MGITITYQEYDHLCQVISKLNLNLKKLPTIEELSSMSGENTPFFLGFLVWLIEMEGDMKKSSKYQSVKDATMDTLDDGMIYIPLKKDDSIENEKIRISFADYERVYQICVKMSFLGPASLPTMAEIKNNILPVAKFCFGLILILLVKNKQNSSKKTYRELLKLLNDTFELDGKDDLLKMSKPDYEIVRTRAANIRINRKNWWPTMEEVKNIIEPNFNICFPFVVWILETGSADTLEEKNVKSALHRLLSSRTMLYSDNQVEMLLES